jgi:site-specific DNA-methyltransferase (adenine-specific)/modification methylase
MPERIQRCPACRRTKTRKHGLNRRGVQQYQCLNTRCSTNWFIDPACRKPPQTRAVYMRAYRARQRLQDSILHATTIGPCILYHGDCQKMPSLLQGATLLLTDPPYGIAYRQKPSRNKLVHPDTVHAMIAGDAPPFDPTHLLQLGIPKMILWGGDHYIDRQQYGGTLWTWNKLADTSPHDGADCEYAWTNVKGPARLFSFLSRGIMRAGVDNLSVGGSRKHPNQKPPELMEWCLDKAEVAPQNDLVADPYMGAGPVGMACLWRGIRYVGIEIEQKYYDRAVRRLQQEAEYLRLVAEHLRRERPDVFAAWQRGEYPSVLAAAHAAGRVIPRARAG